MSRLVRCVGAANLPERVNKKGKWGSGNARARKIFFWDLNRPVKVGNLWPQFMIDEEWFQNNRTLAGIIAQFMGQGERTHEYKGFSRCQICNKRLGSSDRRIGPFTYPGGASHYIKKHHVRPPSDFIAYIKSAHKKQEKENAVEKKRNQGIHVFLKTFTSESTWLQIFNALQLVFGKNAKEPTAAMMTMSRKMKTLANKGYQTYSYTSSEEMLKAAKKFAAAKVSAQRERQESRNRYRRRRFTK